MRAGSAFLPRWVVVVVGVLGLFVAVDAVLGYIVTIFLLATSGPFNPYVSMVFVVGLPLALAVGLSLSGWAWCRLVEERHVAEEVPGATAIQGL